jgi:anti-anti-sigma regulatory factor
VRRWIGDLERRIHAELGQPAAGERFKSVLAVGAALWTALTLKMDWFQHPKLIRTTYRLPDKRWSGFEMWEDLRRKVASPDFSVQVELQHAKQQVWLRLEGALSAKDAEGLARRISESLARSKNQLVLDLNKLDWDKSTNLQPLRDKLADYRSRIRVALPKLSAAHPELLLVAGMFHHYHG